MSRRKPIVPMSAREQREVVEWLPVIYAAAHRFAGRWRSPMAEFGDYVAAGMLGALEAIRTHDATRGSLGARVNTKVRLAMVDYRRDTMKFRSRHPPTFVSFDDGLGDVLGRGDRMIGNDNFDDLVASLKGRERVVLRRHFVDGEVYSAIADDMGISVAGVSYIVIRSLEKLRLRFQQEGMAAAC